MIFLMVHLLVEISSVFGEVEPWNYCKTDRTGCLEDIGTYNNIEITDSRDYLIRNRLDDDLEVMKLRVKVGLKKMKKTLELHPTSPRAMFNLANAHSKMYQQYKKENDNENGKEHLEKGIELTTKLVDLPEEKILSRLHAESCILLVGMAKETKNNTRIIASASAAIAVLQGLWVAEETITVVGEILITHLMWEGEVEKTLDVCRKLTDRNLNTRDSSGHVIKTSGQFLEGVDVTIVHILIIRIGLEKYLEGLVANQLIAGARNSVDFLREKDKNMYQKNKDSLDNYIADAKSHGADKDLIEELFTAGISAGFYMSRYQRPVDGLVGLRSKPLWKMEDLEAGLVTKLQNMQQQWKTILQEGLELEKKEGKWLRDEMDLIDIGQWDQLQILGRAIGKVDGLPARQKVCRYAPVTCKLVDQIEEANCNICTSKWSVLGPHSHISPHNGPTNKRLRLHLGLKIPSEGTRLRLSDSNVTWSEGNWMIFDDSFEHEVWNTSNQKRMIFILDIHHPDLTQEQRNQDNFHVVNPSQKPTNWAKHITLL